MEISTVWSVRCWTHWNLQKPMAKHSEQRFIVPAWDLFAHQQYRPSAHRYLQQPVLPVFASRSCPFPCDFCPHTLFNTSENYAARDTEEIVEEIRQLQQEYGVKY